MNAEPRSIHLATGLAIWAAWFVLIYGGQAVACEFARPEAGDSVLTGINLFLLVSGVIVTAILLLLARGYQRAALAAHRSDLKLPRFIHGVAAAGCLAATSSTIFISIPMVVLPACV